MPAHKIEIKPGDFGQVRNMAKKTAETAAGLSTGESNQYID